MWGELEMQQLLAQLFWLNAEVPEAVERFLDTVPSYQAAKREYEQAARQIEAAVGLPAYEDYFAKLADFGSYLQGGYYAFGLGLRQELIRQMLG